MCRYRLPPRYLGKKGIKQLVYAKSEVSYSKNDDRGNTADHEGVLHCRCTSIAQDARLRSHSSGEHGTGDTDGSHGFLPHSAAVNPPAKRTERARDAADSTTKEDWTTYVPAN